MKTELPCYQCFYSDRKRAETCSPQDCDQLTDVLLADDPETRELMVMTNFREIMLYQDVVLKAAARHYWKEQTPSALEELERVVEFVHGKIECL